MRASFIGDPEIAGRSHRLDHGNGESGRALRSPQPLGSVWLGLVMTLLSSMLLAIPAVAAPTTYSGEAAVADQSESARAGALKSALTEVVIRLTGDSAVLARDHVAAAVSAAGKYALQYSYRRDTTLDEATGAVKPQLVLVAEFDKTAVDRILAGLGAGGGGSTATIDATPIEKRIWLSGIHSASDYARGIGFLSRQPQLRQFWPIEARGDGILVHVVLAGDFNRWLGHLEQGGVMQVNSASPPVQGIDATLALRP